MRHESRNREMRRILSRERKRRPRRFRLKAERLDYDSEAELTKAIEEIGK
jgi:hypothetical protein